nr:ABC transporter permease [Treponema sp.]
MNLILGLIPSVLMIVSPILITAAGGMVAERSGVTNIALEGLMGIGAFSAAAAHVLMESTVPGSEWIALLIGAFFGMIFSLIHAYAAISLNADQTISGTGINLLASGITIFFSQILFAADRTTPFKMGMKSGIFGIYPTFWIAVIIMVAIWFVMYKLPFGLRLRACGE